MTARWLLCVEPSGAAYVRPTLDGRVGSELDEELDEFEVADEGGLVQTESGTVCAVLLTGARDDRFDLRQGHAELGEDVGRERLVNAEQAEEHVLVPAHAAPVLPELPGGPDDADPHPVRSAAPSRLSRLLTLSARV